jgi:hypothetical protein
MRRFSSFLASLRAFLELLRFIVIVIVYEAFAVVDRIFAYLANVGQFAYTFVTVTEWFVVDVCHNYLLVLQRQKRLFFFSSSKCST